MAFVELSVRQQVHRLRRVALEALAQFPVEPVAVRLISHAYNTSFRVDTADGRRFALRINVQSRRRPEWIAAEMAWQEAIARATDLWVAMPQRTRTGALTATVPFEPLATDLTAVLYSWLPGGNLGDGVTPARMRVVGGAMATLHTHAERWTLPPGTDLPVFDDPLFGLADHMATSTLLDDEQRDVLARVLDATRRQYAEMFANASPIALHADLHQWNMKWWRGRLSVFDFDDSGRGLPIQDLAISAYYVRRVNPDLERALHEGYASSRALPDVMSPHYEGNLAVRNLVLLNDVLTTVNAETRAALAAYVPTSVARLRHWLDTGTYDFGVTAERAG